MTIGDRAHVNVSGDWSEVRATSGLGRDDVLATARALLFDNSLGLYGAPLDG